MSSITYSERIKIETFCELGLSNIQICIQQLDSQKLHYNILNFFYLLPYYLQNHIRKNREEII
ncbi:hypothetical protein EFQ36_10605 [Limosilactobacillus fermentum]|nr:hypothetical protein [Limosilactobacillus fermentum]MCT3447445.1 hypothetical protein [Limosilactobacillus fermentum]MCT3448108.1 hypothetical protein [Limosilactobacillus fermentum]MCT3448626.1 hypothetical protein [Limosilactobacillus fermentum]